MLFFLPPFPRPAVIDFSFFILPKTTCIESRHFRKIFAVVVIVGGGDKVHCHYAGVRAALVRLLEAPYGTPDQPWPKTQSI
jgi:hypothetical protein